VISTEKKEKKKKKEGKEVSVDLMSFYRLFPCPGLLRDAPTLDNIQERVSSTHNAS
jgi:hypothetical protein